MATAVRRVGRILDRLTALTPDVQPIVFDRTASPEVIGHRRAELATRGTVTAGRVQWDDEPIPYTLTDKGHRMSTYSGPQRKGARRILRELKRDEAEQRNALTTPERRKAARKAAQQ